ncbi:DUF1579 domain-containing protein [bacterium]|nr:DUF1579 domain-containing protein [bacterium]
MKQLFFIIISVFIAAAHAGDPNPTTNTAPPEWMKYTVPGEGHKALNDMVGNWKYTSKWWMASGAKPETSEGTATNKWALDGRFVQQDVKGTAMGQPFMGIGFTGYDSFKKTYQSVWMDNMSTAMMVVSGNHDAKSKTLHETGVMSSPMDNMKDKAFRNETKFKNKNAYVFSMYTKDAAGKEFKMLEMEYTRIQ